ncbi:MAG: LysR substrate-binding domain-containing protein [Verrucomicrobia bacterium]|nr:LysR substrate-binding domain-containing protein [Verrucomicrobiota bacterium]MDA1005458.1 LysR substrate-binding domain-containing protein [Verrucomicrobiota bacterium]
MELRHLRYFMAVAEELSFSKAGERLRIAQPALSRAVGELEADIGVQLFDRSRRQVRLTPAGEALWRESGIIFERLDDSIRRVRETARGEVGELRVGYIGPPTRGFLGALLKEFREKHPGVMLVIEERTPERVWEMVSKGRLSIGLTRPVRSHDELGPQSRKLLDERLCVAVPLDHPFALRKSVRWKELGGQSLVLLARREGAGSHDAIVSACREAEVLPEIVRTPSLMGTILQYVESGTGLGIVPECAQGESNGVVLVPLTPKRTIPLVLVWSKDAVNPAADAFRKLVLDAF